MTDSVRPPEPLDNTGLRFLVLINLAAGFYIGDQFWVAFRYPTASPNSVTLVEAAYITALWSRVVAISAIVMAFDVLAIGLAICVRLNALQHAVLFRDRNQP